MEFSGQCAGAFHRWLKSDPMPDSSFAFRAIPFSRPRVGSSLIEPEASCMTESKSPYSSTSEAGERVRVSLSALIRLSQAAGGLKPRHADIRALHGGDYLSRFKGRGMEFHETRIYVPGDDARNIDWRVTARTGKTHTKLFREERERPVFLSVDARATMFFATRGVFKYVQAARLAALMAWSAQAHGDRVGGQIFREQGGVELKPEHGRRAVLHFLQMLAEAAPSMESPDGSGLDQALSRLVRHARPGSLALIFSDFRGLTEIGEFSLMRLRRHCDVGLAFLSDPLERNPPAGGRYRFAFAGRELSLDASPQAAAQIEKRFLARRQSVRELARRCGMRFIPCMTTDDPLTTLQTYLHSSRGNACRP
jgi:uncharacterized protein (DUF58 family)